MTAHLPPIGVIGLPTLVQHCHDLGLATLTGPEPEVAAATIVEHVTLHGPVPVLVADTIAPRVRAELDDLAAVTAVVITTHDGATRYADAPEGVFVVPLPATVAQALAVLGLTGLPEAADRLAVDVSAAPDRSPVAGVYLGVTTQDPTPVHLTAVPDTLTDAVTPALAEVPEVTRGDDPAPAHAPGRHAAPAPDETDPAEAAVAEAAADPHVDNVVVCWSGKGGVGKSTFSLGLAQAAAAAGLRVALIDANVGQGDLRTYLRLGAAGLPSIYQAATGAAAAAFIDPATLNASRSLKLEPIDFHVVQAPPPHLADSPDITPGLYLDVVRYAAEHFDLVIIDTQIVEAFDRSGMVAGLVLPLLRAGGHGFAITDASAASVSNLLGRLKWFAASGVPATRQLVTLNRARKHFDELDGVSDVLAEHGTFLGTVFTGDNIPDATNRGRPIGHLPEIGGVLQAALAALTGTSTAAGPDERPGDMSAAEAAAEPEPDRKPRRRGLFGRRR